MGQTCQFQHYSSLPGVIPEIAETLGKVRRGSGVCHVHNETFRSFVNTSLESMKLKETVKAAHESPSMEPVVAG